MLKYHNCKNWNTDACPHKDTPPMILTVFNDQVDALLKDETIVKLKKLCGECTKFK